MLNAILVTGALVYLTTHCGRILMPKTILACDDEKHIVRLIQVNLERAGYTVLTAHDGKEGLEKVRSEKPDLVVLDVMMPMMDGFEVLRNLKGDPATRDIPVIMLTAKAQDADVFRGWQSGVDCYLTKPFNPMELLSFVKRIFKSLEDGGDGEKRIEL
jgi:two-component system alkaline phosphatase synthesis response regulator PhoP/two-component system response regulator VicR